MKRMYVLTVLLFLFLVSTQLFHPKLLPASETTPPPSEPCLFWVTIHTRACLNGTDARPAENMLPGQESAEGCGSTMITAEIRAKQNYQQTFHRCLTEGDQPSSGCCTYYMTAVDGGVYRDGEAAPK